jgi:hypothetical protein
MLAVSRALGTSAGARSWWHGWWESGGLRSGTQTRATGAGAQRLGTDAVERGGVRDTMSPWADCCAPLVVQEASHRWKTWIPVMDAACRRPSWRNGEILGGSAFSALSQDGSFSSGFVHNELMRLCFLRWQAKFLQFLGKAQTVGELRIHASGDKSRGMMAQEGAPCRRWRTGPSSHVLRNGGARDPDAELCQFALDAWCAP